MGEQTIFFDGREKRAASSRRKKEPSLARKRTMASSLLLPLPRAAPVGPARPRGSSSSIAVLASNKSRSRSKQADERLSRRDDEANDNGRRRGQIAFASPPSDKNEGDEIVQETLAEMIRLQVGAEEVKEFVEKESEKLRESAEKVRKMAGDGGKNSTSSRPPLTDSSLFRSARLYKP